MSDEADGELRMVAVFRADLPLPEGKLAAQAGHAFVGALLEALDRDVEMATAYIESVAQVKIVLVAAGVDDLRRVQEKADNRGVITYLVTDAARTVLPEPTVTVLGIGPMNKTDSNAITRGLALL